MESIKDLLGENNLTIQEVNTRLKAIQKELEGYAHVSHLNDDIISGNILDLTQQLQFLNEFIINRNPAPYLEYIKRIKEKEEIDRKKWQLVEEQRKREEQEEYKSLIQRFYGYRNEINSPKEHFFSIINELSANNSNELITTVFRNSFHGKNFIKIHGNIYEHIYKNTPQRDKHKLRVYGKKTDELTDILRFIYAYEAYVQLKKNNGENCSVIITESNTLTFQYETDKYPLYSDRKLCLKEILKGKREGIKYKVTCSLKCTLVAKYDSEIRSLEHYFKEIRYTGTIR